MPKLNFDPELAYVLAEDASWGHMKMMDATTDHERAFYARLIANDWEQAFRWIQPTGYFGDEA